MSGLAGRVPGVDRTPSYRAARRLFAFGVTCFVAGWVLAGAIEFYATSFVVGVAVGAAALLVALLVIAWAADRTAGL